MTIYAIAFDRLNRLKLEKLNQGIYTRYQYEHTYDSAGEENGTGYFRHVSPTA